MKFRYLLVFLIATCLVFLGAGSADAEERKSPAPAGEVARQAPRVAVLPVVAGGISREMREQYESVVVSALSRRYTVLPMQEVEAAMREVLAEVGRKAGTDQQCDDTVCYRKIGVKLNVEYVTTVKAVKLDEGYSIAIDVRDVQTGKMDSFTGQCVGCSALQLSKELSALAATVDTGDTASSQSPAPPASPQVRAKEEGPQTPSGPKLEFVIVDSDPEGAKAELVDGKGRVVSTAATPGVLKAPAGKYEVRISLAGYRPKRFDVEVTPGSRAEIGKAEAALVRQMGSIVVDTAPLAKDAVVYVDGAKAGAVLESIAVAVGSHEVEARAGKQSGKRSVSVKEGEEVSVTIEFPGAKVGANSFAPDGMVFVKGGCFEMGSNEGDNDEKPVHRVCVDDFSMDKTEVTQAAYENVMGTNPSSFKDCPDCPVETVDWNQASAYCAKVGKRLPTEAEWEYSARSGGKDEKYAGTSDENRLGDYAWSYDNSRSETHPVGQKKPNGLGLYDMSGNVWEWVADWYGYYGQSGERNPTGPSSGSSKVLRGGSWAHFASGLRASDRYAAPDNRNNSNGFRCSQ